jgi:hypothetical protein
LRVAHIAPEGNKLEVKENRSYFPARTIKRKQRKENFQPYSLRIKYRFLSPMLFLRFVKNDSIFDTSSDKLMEISGPRDGFLAKSSCTI